MEKEKVTTRLDTRLRRRLKVYAATAGLTVEDVVSTAIVEHLASKDTAAGVISLPASLTPETSAAPAR